MFGKIHAYSEKSPNTIIVNLERLVKCNGQLLLFSWDIVYDYDAMYIFRVDFLHIFHYSVHILYIKYKKILEYSEILW